LRSDVALPKAGKMPALPGKSAHETKLFTLNRYNRERAGFGLFTTAPAVPIRDSRNLLAGIQTGVPSVAGFPLKACGNDGPMPAGKFKHRHFAV